MGLEGHSDADAICHAITDAILAFPIAYYMARVASGRARGLLLVSISEHVGFDLAYASAAVNFMRQLGGAIGVNLLAVVLEWRSSVPGLVDAARPFHECFAIVTLAFALAIVPARSIRRPGR